MDDDDRDISQGLGSDPWAGMLTLRELQRIVDYIESLKSLIRVADSTASHIEEVADGLGFGIMTEISDEEVDEQLGGN